MYGETETEFKLDAKGEKMKNLALVAVVVVSFVVAGCATANAQSYVFTTKVQTTGQHKTLDVLLKNGTVTNFTYTDRPEPLGSVQVQ